ncbi:MAG: hypothetical protein J6V77_02840, partial [Clostridia bacterium]|nr:hypothetical protein [Clostridia bacterium]
DVYDESYEGQNIPAKGAKWSLGLTKAAGTIDQLEIVIYIAGADTDANHGSLNGAKGAIEIFFVTSTEAQG